MKIPWLQSLFTLRKSSGGFEVPELDADGRIRVSTVEVVAIEVGSTAPSNTSGQVLWNNTTAGEEGILFYDQTRDKWLSTESGSLFWGEDSADGVVLEPVGVRTMSAGGGYLMRRDGTIIGISAYADGGLATKSFEVRINNSSPAAIAFSLSGSVYTDNTLDIDFSAGDLLNAGALAPGAAATDVTLILTYRWRS